MMIKVADLYELSKFSGKYDEDLSRARLKTKSAKVDEDYAKRISMNWRISGKMYVVDDEATEQWYKNRDLAIRSQKELRVNMRIAQTEHSQMLAAENLRILNESQKSVEPVDNNQVIELDLGIKGKGGKNA